MPTKKTTEPTDWGARGPNDEPPNVRLAAEAEPKTYYRTGSVEYALPATADGEPDAALQRAGFWHAYAHRLVALAPGYLLIVPKGVKP